MQVSRRSAQRGARAPGFPISALDRKTYCRDKCVYEIKRRWKRKREAGRLSCKF